MTSSNIVYKGTLAVGAYFSCYAFCLAVIYGAYEVYKGNGLPMRIYIPVSIICIFWAYLAYISEEVYWRSLAKLVSYSLMLISFLALLFGFALLVRSFSDESFVISVRSSLIIILVSGFLGVALYRLVNSKWLNS